MSTKSYTRFVKILEKWPLDPNKKGKDIGEALRLLFSQSFPLGSSSVVNEKVMNKKLDALESLLANESLKRFPRESTANFTLLDQETLSGITSTEFMGQVSASSNTKQSLMERLKNIRLL